jgi:hypothetical protein
VRTAPKGPGTGGAVPFRNYGAILVRFCTHGVQIEGPRTKRAGGCLSCHADAAAAARKRSAARRAAFTKEERKAFLQYFRDYGQKNKARNVARARLRRAEKRLSRAGSHL